MLNRTIKPNKIKFAIGQHLLKNLDWSKDYNHNSFSIVTRERNTYRLCVLKYLFNKTLKPNLCKNQLVYKLNLYKLL